jgi:hypothetical protein
VVQVRDLRRLLELYQRWHPRLFNHCDYNQFETTLEKMSGSNAIKVSRHPAAGAAARTAEQAASAPICF